MGKRGYNPYGKQSSPISSNQVVALMQEYNFSVEKCAEPMEIKTAFRRSVRAAMNRFGEDAHISQKGESVFFEGRHVRTGAVVKGLRVHLSNMLGIGEREALFEKTGIPELNPRLPS